MMKNAILSSGDTKFKTSLYSFNIKKTESVEVKDLDSIPRAYLRLKKEADKVAIKKALKDGEVIDGVYLSEKQSLGVK